MDQKQLQEYAKLFKKELDVTKKTLKERITKKLVKPLRLDNGLYPASTLVESINWKRVTVEISYNVFKSLLWNRISHEAKSSSGTHLRAVFFTLSEFSQFWASAFGCRWLKFTEGVGGDTSTIFVCPYATAKAPFMDADFDEFKELYAEQGWKRIQLDTAVQNGRLLCSFKNTNPQLVFVLDEYTVEFNGKKAIFYKVILPDESAKKAELMPGVSFSGQKGVVPSSVIAQRNARLPFISYRCKAHMHQLSKLVFGFRPMQVVNQKLTWKVKPLYAVDEEDERDEVAIAIPAGYERSVAPITQNFLDSGSLTNMLVMFKFYEDQWQCFRVLNFIPETQRTPESPYTYGVQIVSGGRGKLSVLFRIELYDAASPPDAELGTWFMLTFQNSESDQDFDL